MPLFRTLVFQRVFGRPNSKKKVRPRTDEMLNLPQHDL